MDRKSVGLDLSPFFFKGGKIGCLLIHGGTGSPPEMRGLGEFLAAQGLTVLGVRLAGHGTVPEDLLTITWQDLVVSAEDGFRQLQAQCDAVFVAGLSLGGLIALYLAAHYPLRGAILMSTPAYISNWRLRILPLYRIFRPWFYSSGELDATDPEAANRVWFYRRIPTSFGQQVGRLLIEVRRSLARVQTPLLIMQGAHDQSIPSQSAQLIYDRVNSPDKEIVWFPNSGHPITVDSERETVWARVYQFILRHQGG